MEKQLLKETLLKVEAGKFFQALGLLKSVQLDKPKAIYIFHVASKTCRIVAEACDVEAVEQLCNILVPYLDTLDEPDLTNYFRSLYYIMKLLCNRERFEDVPKMKAVLVPNFINEDILKNTPEPAGVYIAIMQLLSESLYRFGKAKSTNLKSYMLEIIELLLQLRNKFDSLKGLMDLVDSCYKILHLYEANNDQVLTFYNIVLDVVSSKFGKVDEYSSSIQVRLALIVSYILTDAIKKENFLFAEKFLDYVESAIGNFMMQEGFIQTHVIFKAVTALFPHSDDEMEKSVNNARLFLSYFKSSNKKLFYNVAYFLEQPVRQLLLFYEKSGLQIWNQLLDTRLLDISQFIMDDIICHSMIYTKKCNCGCAVTKNYYGMLDVGCLLIRLLKSYLKEFENPSNDLVSHVGKMFNQLYAVVKKLKEAGCQEWYWSYDKLSAENWNISIKLLNSNHVSLKGMVRCFLINGLELDGINPEIREINIYTTAFQALCKLEIEQNNWRGSMGLAALYCLLYTSKRNTIFHHFWVEPKIKNKAEVGTREQTLVNILFAQYSQLSHILNFKSLLTTSKQVELLVFELGRYKSTWMSKESMMASFAHLVKIADINKVAEVFVAIYGDGNVPVHIDYMSLLANIKNKFETFLKNDLSNSIVKLALATAYFHIFKLSCKEAVERNREEMELCMKLSTSAAHHKQMEPIPKDRDDECDIVSAYSNLRLCKSTEVLKSLDACLDIISGLMQAELEPETIKNVANLLTLVGFEYRLHCLSVKSLIAFHMSMKYSERIEDYEGWLFALSFLIESADVTENYVIELIKKGDELSALLQNDKINEGCNKTLVIYYICKSKAYLIENPNISYEAWKAADSFCDANEDKRGFAMLRAQLHVILHKLTRSCDFIEGHHDEAPMAYHLHAAYDIVIELVENTVVDSYCLCVVLDTIYELSKIYSLMRLPRDARSYAKCTALLTQKRLLPVRCISSLILLAHCDVVCCQFDNYNVKLNGIDDIFSLNHFKCSKVENVEGNIEEDVDECSALIGGLVMASPQHTRQFAPSSPSLTVEGFQLPKFLSHKQECLCFMCLSLESQDLLLKKYHLTSLANMYQQENELAEEFTTGSLKVYEKLARNFAAFKSKVSKRVPESLIPNFENMFTESYANILYDYSGHMYRTLRKEEALKMSAELKQILEPKKIQFVYLYQDVLLTIFACLEAPDIQSSGNETASFICESSTSQANSANIPITPVNKIAPVNLMVNGIEHFSPPKKNFNKCNLFLTQSDSADPSAKRSGAIPKSKTAKSTQSVNIFTDDDPGVGASNRKKRTTKKLFFESKHCSVKGPKAACSSSSIESIQSHEPSTSRATRSRTQRQAAPPSEDWTIPTSVPSRNSVRDKDKRLTSTQKNKSDPIQSELDNTSVIPNSPENAGCEKKKKDLMVKIKTSANKSRSKKK